MKHLACFCLDRDAKSKTPDAKLVFNRTTTLKDAWTEEAQKA